MKNPFYVDPKVTAFDNAAAAVALYMQANSWRSDIPAAELVALPEVQDILVGGSLPDSYRTEVENRLSKLVMAA